MADFTRAQADTIAQEAEILLKQVERIRSVGERYPSVAEAVDNIKNVAFRLQGYAICRNMNNIGARLPMSQIRQGAR